MIILCPYAQSSSQMEEKYLQRAIEYFHKNDYLVFTNVGKNQVELKNTKRLFNPVDVYVALGYMGATIICVHENIHRDEYGSGRDECDEALKMKMFGVSSYRFELRVPMNIPDEDKIMDSAMIVPAKTEKTARELLSQNE